MKLVRSAKLLLILPLLVLGVPAGWSRTPSPGSPDKRLHHSIIHDAAGRRLILFGGLQSRTTFGDVWAMSVGSGFWKPLATRGTPPPARWGHTAIYDPVRSRMLVFGGFNPIIQSLGDVWELSLGRDPTWTQVVPAGSAPTPRFAHTAIHDGQRDRMIVYAGFDGLFKDDVWELTLDGTPTWSPLFPSGTSPSPRDAQVAIYDPVGDRMIVHGGFDGLLSVGDVWALSLASPLEWSEIVPQGSIPPPRRQHAAAYDVAGQRLVIFGGTQTGSDLGFADLWELPLDGSPAWRQLQPAGSSPSSRWGTSLTYVASRDRFVLFGGVNLVDWQGDTWILTPEPKLEWELGKSSP